MDKIKIKLQIDLIKRVFDVIEEWQQQEYAEMMSQDVKEHLIISGLLDVVSNFYEIHAAGLDPEAIVAGLERRLGFESDEGEEIVIVDDLSDESELDDALRLIIKNMLDKENDS